MRRRRGEDLTEEKNHLSLVGEKWIGVFRAQIAGIVMSQGTETRRHAAWPKHEVCPQQQWEGTARKADWNAISEGQVKEFGLGSVWPRLAVGDFWGGGGSGGWLKQLNRNYITW